MSITFGPDGIEFPELSGASQLYNRQKSGWFYYRHTTTSGFNFGNSWVEGQVTGSMTLPPRSKVFVYTYTPLRGDTNNWGGHYEDLFYEVNGGSWTSLGRSGFVSRMMTSNYPITKHTDCVMMDFYSLTSDFTLRFRTTHRYYNDGGAVLNSCGQSYGSNDTSNTSDNQQYSAGKQIIVMGFAQD